MFYFSIYLLLINVYCSVVTFQCCVSFYCITKWISHTYIYIYPLPFGFPFYLGYHSVLSWVHYSMFLSVVYFIHSINSAYESFQPPDSSHPTPFQSFPRGTTGKNPPAVQGPQEIRVWSLGWEDALEEGVATHSSILAWRIPMDRRACQAKVHRVA